MTPEIKALANELSKRIFIIMSVFTVLLAVMLMSGQAKGNMLQVPFVWVNMIAGIAYVLTFSGNVDNGKTKIINRIIENIKLKGNSK